MLAGDDQTLSDDTKLEETLNLGFPQAERLVFEQQVAIVKINDGC